MIEILVLLTGAVLVPLVYPFMASERVFLGYIITSFLPVAFLAWRANEWRWDIRHFWEVCFPKALWLHPSTKVDFHFFFINTICFTTLLVPFLAFSAGAAQGMLSILNDWLGENHSPMAVTPMAVLMVTIGIAVCSDFAVFFAHYLQHKVSFLWEFHKVHHSAEVLTPITVYRMHPVDDLLTLSLGGLLMGAGMGAAQYLFDVQPQPLHVAGLNLITFIFYLTFYNLRHSQYWLHYPGILGTVFISPAQHQIHHSSLERHWDKNFGFIFGIWDWMFRTLYVPKGKEELILGIGPETTEFNSVSALYFLPFKKNWRRLKKRLGLGNAAVSPHSPSHQ